MTPEMKKKRRAVDLQTKAHIATFRAAFVVQRFTAEDVLVAPPYVRERLVEMAAACEAFVKAWEGRAK